MPDEVVSSLGIRPTLVVVSLGVAAYDRRYARRQLELGLTSLVMGFPAIMLSAHAHSVVLLNLDIVYIGVGTHILYLFYRQNCLNVNLHA